MAMIREDGLLGGLCAKTARVIGVRRRNTPGDAGSVVVYILLDKSPVKIRACVSGV
jgi:hypothetical protein